MTAIPVIRTSKRVGRGIHGKKPAPAVNGDPLRIPGLSPPGFSRLTTFALIRATTASPSRPQRPTLTGCNEPSLTKAFPPSTQPIWASNTTEGFSRHRPPSFPPAFLHLSAPASRSLVGGGGTSSLPKSTLPSRWPRKAGNRRPGLRPKGRQEPTPGGWGWGGGVTGDPPSPRVGRGKGVLSSAYLTSPPAPAHPSSRAAPSAPTPGTPGWSAAS